MSMQQMMMGMIASSASSGWTPGVNTVAYYKLENNANDSSGNGYNGTWFGTAGYATGKIGDSASFNGSSWISLPSGVKPSGDFTLSFWIKHSGNFTGNGDAIFSTNYAGARRGFVLYGFLSDGCSIQFRNSSGIVLGSLERGTAKTFWSDNTRHNLIATYDDSTKTLKTYLDGEYINNVTLSSSPQYTTNTMLIGKSEDTYWKYYTGGLDEIIIENKARTSTEVSDYYNSI